MEIDWDWVKKTTLWHYETLIAKLLEVLEYTFVQENYGHDMTEAGIYSENIRQGYLQTAKETEFIVEITTDFNHLNVLGIRNYQDLVAKVATKSKCELFLQETGFRFEALIRVENYLFRWVLPFKIPVQELLDTMPNGHTTNSAFWKEHKIRSNLDVLEAFRSTNGRKMFAIEMGVDRHYLLKLTHRADMSRLAFVRGKTIGHLCGGGYDSLRKLADANRVKMVADMTAYYESIGKSFVDFKTVIPLDWMIGGASILPEIVEAE